MFSVIFVIFEVHPKQEKFDLYLDLAKGLKPILEDIDGFIENQRFESTRRRGWILSHSTWRDEKSVVRWRTVGKHHDTQQRGRDEVFQDYHFAGGRERQGHATAGRRGDRSRRRSYRPGHPLRRAAEQRCPKLGIRRHQSIKRETPIETARIGKNPGHRACKSRRVLAPLDIWLADHGREGSLSEKGYRTRGITPDLGFKPESSLQEFFRQHLIRPLGRPADDRGDAAAIFEQTTLVLWLEPNVRETRELQHRPEAIASTREVVAGTCSARARIQAAENHVKAAVEDIWFVSAQVTPLSANALHPMAQSSGGNCPATPPQLSWQEGP
jgi:heme-degrading monooxygenase HmoA